MELRLCSMLLDNLCVENILITFIVAWIYTPPYALSRFPRYSAHRKTLFSREHRGMQSWEFRAASLLTTVVKQIEAYHSSFTMRLLIANILEQDRGYYLKSPVVALMPKKIGCKVLEICNLSKYLFELINLRRVLFFL